MTRRHLLLTAWAFPPARTSGVYRAAGIANAFAAAGWDVTVLCGPASLFRSNGIADESLLETLDDRIRVVEVPLEHHELSTDISGWSWLRARHPELWTKRRLMQDRRGFPEDWFGSWAAPLRAAASEVHSRRPVTLALGTAAPSVDFVPGEHLHARHGVPYILDYRDAWTFSTFTGNPPASLSDDVRRREQKLMDSAYRAWFVNDPIRHWHADLYPARASMMRTVRNGFDLPAGVDDPTSLGVAHRESTESGVVFGYIGTINFGAFPLEAVVEGWRRARPRLPAESRLVLRGHLGRTGVGSPKLMAALAEAATIGIDYDGPVARNRVWDAYRDYDALLLALPSGPGVTSGKVYEYAATGLPVVSVHTDDTPTGEVLEGGGNWIPTSSLHPDNVAEAFIEAAARAQSQTSEERIAAIEWGAQWERGAQLSAAVRDLTELVDERIDP